MKNFLLYRGQMYINTLKLLHLSKTDSWGQKKFPRKNLHELSGVPEKSRFTGYGNFNLFNSNIGYLCPIWPQEHHEHVQISTT